MITPLQAVRLCALIYNDLSPQSWDHIDPGPDDGICWGIKKLDGFDIIVFRGSRTVPDWIADFRAVPILTRVGHVHAGFYDGMEKLWSEAKRLITQPAVVTGHSLGAARAAVMTALMAADLRAPVVRIVFGEPKPGFLDFAAGIKDIPGFSFRNGDAVHHDLVTDVPFSFPPFQFMHPTPVIVVTTEPTGDLFERHGVFAYHHIELYVAAFTALAAAKTAA